MKILHLMGPAPLCTNCYILLDGAGGAVVIDPAAALADMEKALESAGAGAQAILLTHGHYDHMFSLDAARRRWGCPVYLDEADAAGTELFPQKQGGLPFADGEELRLAGLAVTPYHTPGHSRGSWVFSCGGALFTGDTLFAGDVGRTDLPGGSWDQLCRSLARLRGLGLDPGTRVLPGHGPASTFGAELAGNPYLHLKES